LSLGIIRDISRGHGVFKQYRIVQVLVNFIDIAYYS
jgi:hypothetical protein